MSSGGTARGTGGSDFVDGRHHRHLVGDVGACAEGAVTASRDPDGATTWLVSGYQQTREFLRDERFSRAAASESCHYRGPAVRMSITEMDRPRHTRVRNLIGGAFSARRVELLRPRLKELAERLLAAAIEAGPPADLLADFCAPLTFGAHCELLGVPQARREAVRRCSLDRLGTPDTADPARTYRAELDLHAEVTELLTDPGLPAGLLADLVAQRDQGHLTGTELNGLAASLFFDGYALAAAQIANAVLCLLTRPALLGSLRADAGLLGSVLEESLRYSPSVTLSMARIATTDLVFHGAAIRAGDRVAAALPLANRDTAAFDDPGGFDPARTANRHLTFGFGTHHCLGAHLARVEMAAAISALLRHAPDVTLAVPEHELAWYASPTVRSLAALPVRWH